jgi:hypothetical protein
MAIFSGQRDMALFRRLNKELINDIIDTEIYYYKMILPDIKSNIYGEASDKIFYNPVKVPCLIDREGRDDKFEEFGNDYARVISFYFLRDTLQELNLFPQPGDAIEWNNEQLVVDTANSNQFFAGKNPSTWDGGDSQGYNVSIICKAHVVRRSELKLRDDFRVGIDRNNNDNDFYK